jgi:prepilin signal peptidase PulO-like enzyme (type II secretory pathway)
MVELITAGVVVSYFWLNGFNGLADIYYLAAAVLFVSLVFFDLRYLILPDKIVFTIGGLAILYDVFFRYDELWNLLLSGVLFAFGFAIIYLGSRGRAMGFGDVKLAFVIGLVLGYPAGFFSIILSIWVAALWGIILILSNKATMKTALPFGSFLSASAVIFIIFKNLIEDLALYGYFF